MEMGVVQNGVLRMNVVQKGGVHKGSGVNWMAPCLNYVHYE